MKYIGSKAKIANEIVPILQSYITAYNIKQYVEPFAGGFNVIDKIQCEYRLGNDIDPLVCELVEACRENPALLDELETPTRAEYYDVRDNPDKYARWYRGRCFYSARTMPACTAVAMARPPPQKAAKPEITLSKHARIFAVNYPHCAISLSGAPIIGNCDSPNGSGYLYIATRRIRTVSVTAAANSIRRSFGIGAGNKRRRVISLLQANTPRPTTSFVFGNTK